MSVLALSCLIFVSTLGGIFLDPSAARYRGWFLFRSAGEARHTNMPVVLEKITGRAIGEYYHGDFPVGTVLINV
jgi:hypothetical protein